MVCALRTDTPDLSLRGLVLATQLRADEGMEFTKQNRIEGLEDFQYKGESDGKEPG